MPVRSARRSLLAIPCMLVWAAAGCGGSSAGQGGERQACYPNGTCNAGLTCASNVCVRFSSGGAGGSGGNSGGRGGASDAAGASGTTGAAGTTGAGGAAGTGTAGTGGAAGIAGTGGTGGMAGGGAGGVAGQAGGISCGSIEQPATNLPPDILLLQDASGSMNEDATNTSCGNGGCGANSKWALMTPGIYQAVSQTEARVNWGLKLFADSGACGVSNNATVAVGPANAAPIATALAGRTDAGGNVVNGSSTPTRAAENAAVNYLSTLAGANPKLIVLATDGQPNCPMTGSQTNDDSPAAIAAVTAARLAGIPTVVVGISVAGGSAEVTLNTMAVEGGRAQVGQPTKFYSVSSTAEFASVLRTAVVLPNTCTFSIPVPPTSDGTTSRADISVRATGGGTAMEIAPDASNGWTYADADMTAVALHGAACDQWAAQTITAVAIVFHCRTN